MDTSSRVGIVFAVVAAAVILPFGESVIGVQLAGIEHDLMPGPTAAQWIVNAYLLTFATSILAAGTLADRIGRRRIFVAGLWLCAASNIASIMVPSAALLIVLRATSGMAAGMLLATGPAILAHAFPALDQSRGRAFVAFGAAAGSGIALGPVIGGAVVTVADWRWVFVLYLPFIALALLLAPRITESRNPDSQHLDITGVVLFTGALACVMIAMIRGSEHGWASLVPWFALGAAAALLLLFARVERHSRQPAVDLLLFREPVFAAMSLLLLCWQLAVATLMVYVPAVIASGLHVSSLIAGAAILPLALPLFGATPLGPRLVAGLGTGWFVGICVGLMLLGQMLLWMLMPTGATVMIVGLGGGLFCIGLGGGIANGTVDNLAMSTVSVARAGMAAGVFQTVRIGGAAIAVTLAGGVLILPDHGRAIDGTTVMASFHQLTAMLAVLIALLGTAALVLLVRAGRSTAAR